MKFSLTVLESQSDISKLILEQIRSIIDKAINKALPRISSELKQLIAEALRSQPEYASLLSGTLRAELGLSSTDVVNKLIDAMVNTLTIETNPIVINNKGIKGGFKLTMIKSDDINGLIYTDIASVIDDAGYSLPWLEWLLLRGNDIIVKNYSVSYTPSEYSRSGMAIMVPSSSNWRVPPNFAGTQKDNWTTRAISSVEKDIYLILQSNIEKYL